MEKFYDLYYITKRDMNKKRFSHEEFIKMFETNNFMVERVLNRKKDWKEFTKGLLDDTSVSDVLMIPAEGGGYYYAGKSSITNPYKNYINSLMEKLGFEGELSDGSYADIVKFGYEDENNLLWKEWRVSVMLKIEIDGVELCLVPYHNGVKIALIKVKEEEKGMGKGTKVMNILYDISEELQIPLYLNPYPADEYEPSKEREMVERLIKWYEGLGFGNVWKKIWCNY